MVFPRCILAVVAHKSTKLSFTLFINLHIRVSIFYDLPNGRVSFCFNNEPAYPVQPSDNFTPLHSHRLLFSTKFNIIYNKSMKISLNTISVALSHGVDPV